MSNVPPPPPADAPEGQPAYQGPPAGYQAPPPGYQPPSYPGAPAYGAAPASVPGKGLSIAGLILAFLAPLIGLILSIIGRSQAKQAGAPTGMATAGIIVSIVVMIVALIIGLAVGVGLLTVFSKCAGLGAGVHEVGGVTYICS